MKKFALASFALFALGFASVAMADSIVSGPAGITGLHGVTFSSKSLSAGNSGLGIGAGWGGASSDVADQAQLNSFIFSGSNQVQLFDLEHGLTNVTFPVEGNIAESFVKGILTISGTGRLGERRFAGGFYPNSNQWNRADVIEVATVAAPEPSSLLLLGTGLLLLAFILFRKAKASGLPVQK